MLVPQAGRPGPGETRDRGRLAPRRLPSLLALAIPAARLPTEDYRGDSPREPGLGSPEDPRRVVEARVTPMSAVRPMAVEDWLKGSDLAPKTKSHVRSLMHTIFQCAERWELTARNPIKLVRVKGGTKRQKTPRVLAPEEFYSLLPLIREPYRTMVLIAGCLGLRVSEIVALQWRDFDFRGRTLLIQRSVVHGR